MIAKKMIIITIKTTTFMTDSMKKCIRNRPIIVFDEATSALDNNTESIIKEAIEKLKGTHIIILIAHRLSTVENADTIYVLDNG